MLTGTIDSYRFIPLPVNIVLTGGHKVRFHDFLAHWSEWHLLRRWSSSSWTCCVRFDKPLEMSAALLNASTNFYFSMHSDVYEQIWNKLGVMIDTTEFYIWYQSMWPWPSVKVTGVPEANTSAPGISHSFRLIWIEVGTLLRLAGLMSLHLVWWIFKGENPTDVIPLKM